SGTCSTCHPADFKLKPANHGVTGFYPKGHAKLALARIDRATGKPVLEAATSAEEASGAAEGKGESTAEALALVSVDAVNYCSTCHDLNTFCNDCHGLEMPHPADFTKSHGALGKKEPTVCANCHATPGTKNASATEFCNACHHPDGNPNKSWLPQHFVVVQKKGAEPCFQCHEPTYCAKCHVRSAL
ncbi:MAG: hypothetical protein LLG08_09460, partial [Actinomycetia bacterium]|nr:hypothetical protein [Actinomycetes bacterium]